MSGKKRKHHPSADDDPTDNRPIPRSPLTELYNPADDYDEDQEAEDQEDQDDSHE
jgi:hypothetical protein